MENNNTQKVGYAVEKIGGMYFVVYTFAHPEKMLMSKPYGTESGANKRMTSIKSQAGVK